MEIPLHVQDNRLTHPLCCLPHIFSRHLVNPDNGVNCHIAHLLSDWTTGQSRIQLNPSTAANNLRVKAERSETKRAVRAGLEPSKFWTLQLVEELETASSQT